MAAGNVEVGGARIAHFDKCSEPVLRSGSSDEVTQAASARLPSFAGWVEDANDRMNLRKVRARTNDVSRIPMREAMVLISDKRQDRKVTAQLVPRR